MCDYGRNGGAVDDGDGDGSSGDSDGADNTRAIHGDSVAQPPDLNSLPPTAYWSGRSGGI